MGDEYEIEFYADKNGREPFRIFLDGLSEAKRLAMIAAEDPCAARPWRLRLRVGQEAR